MIEYFAENNLISPNPSRFRPAYSINQLLSINHEILKQFDVRVKVRGIFLDISKTVDKVCCEASISKFPQNIFGVI